MPAKAKEVSKTQYENVVEPEFDEEFADDDVPELLEIPKGPKVKEVIKALQECDPETVLVLSDHLQQYTMDLDDLEGGRWTSCRLDLREETKLSASEIILYELNSRITELENIAEEFEKLKNENKKEK